METNHIRNLKKSLLSDNWNTLHRVDYELQLKNGQWQKQTREAYQSGNAAAILLFNKEKQTVILVSQFRMPSFLNGNPSGYLIEACAGLLDDEHPEIRIIKEVEEETGYRIEKVQKIFQAYMTPGSVTEMLHFYVAAYTEEMKVTEGGGISEEQEHIEVLELPFSEAFEMIHKGEILDAKTIILLQYCKLNALMD
jgi:GDP-mannose pyrophosphatase NudK